MEQYHKRKRKGLEILGINKNWVVSSFFHLSLLLLSVSEEPGIPVHSSIFWGWVGGWFETGLLCVVLMTVLDLTL